MCIRRLHGHLRKLRWQQRQLGRLWLERPSRRTNQLQPVLERLPLPGLVLQPVQRSRRFDGAPADELLRGLVREYCVVQLFQRFRKRFLRSLRQRFLRTNQRAITRKGAHAVIANISYLRLKYRFAVSISVASIGFIALLGASSQAQPLAERQFTDLNRPAFAQLMTMDDASSKAIFDAGQKVTAECMQEHGFEYLPIEWAAPSPPAQFARPGDIAAASRLGYGLSARNKQVQAPTLGENDTILSRLSIDQRRSWKTALVGVSPNSIIGGPKIPIPGGYLSVDVNGCGSIGRAAVYGDDVGWVKARMALQALSDEVASRVTEDQKFQAAIATWRSCMQGKGYDYERPGAGALSLIARYESGAIDEAAQKALEIQVASADAECYGVADISTVGAELTAEHETRVASLNQATINEYQQIQKMAITQAREILKG